LSSLSTRPPLNPLLHLSPPSIGRFLPSNM
jgi:hypothetical protein